MIYECAYNTDCNFQLDVLCALQIKILHRSHEHRLMVIRGPVSFICGACGAQHRRWSALSYLCNACGFWIHKDCASLPNAINLLHAKHHHHSLFLAYNLPSQSISSLRANYTCSICRGPVKGLGVYICAGCRYYAHIKCAISDPQGFKSVLIRDAKLAGLLHFPMADEYTSVMRYIMENTTSSSDHEVDGHQCQSEGKLVREKLHQHPLIFHDQDDTDGGSHVCNACVQIISPPFYSCSQCPDFFLHSCCANLPSKIQHPVHKQHTLFLFPKAPKSSSSGSFFCQGCREESNRFAYSCNTCDDFSMDVVCALLPPSITHESHGRTHILNMTYKSKFGSQDCSCCNFSSLGIFYKCSNCRNFNLDAHCALFPSTFKHKFDEHLLKLTTMPEKSAGTDDVTICEICEESILLDKWVYSCSQCNQSFHCKCIHGFSKVKLGATIHVNCHDCPLTLIPESTIYGYRCGYCLEAFSPGNWPRPAYECSKCYFRIHDECSGKCFLKS